MSWGFLKSSWKWVVEFHQADIKYSDLSWEECNARRSLADDRNIISKKTDKGLCIVIWGRNDYLMEAEKQLSDKKVDQKEVIVKTFYLS